MIEHGIQRSTVKPEELEFAETRVFISSGIKEVAEEGTGEEPGFEGYEFSLIEYDKDEYVKLQAERNLELESELTQAQVAMCEIYEMMS